MPEPRSETAALVRQIDDALARTGYHVDSLVRVALAALKERLAELERKADAYDRARARVKIEGATRAEYVLHVEAAEAKFAEAEEALEEARGVADGVIWLDINLHNYGSDGWRRYFKALLRDARRLSAALRSLRGEMLTEVSREREEGNA